MLPMHIKVGLVTVLSCLALLLGLLSTPGGALAHSLQATHSQTSVSVSTEGRCFRIFVRRHDFDRRFSHFRGFRHRDFGFFKIVCTRHHHHGFGFRDDGF